MKVVSFFLLLIIAPAMGQDLTPKEADSLLHLLNQSKPGIDRINLLLKLAEYQILKPGEFKIDFDTASSYLEQAAFLNQQVKSSDADAYQLVVEAKMLNEKGQRDEGQKKVEKAIALLEPHGDKALLGKAYYDLSSYYNYWDNEQLKIKLALVEQAKVAYDQSEDLLGKGTTLKMLGDLYNINGEDGKSLVALKMSLAVYDSIHYKRVQGIYALLGRIYKDQNDFKQALSYELQALTTAEAVHDSSMQLCQIHHLLGGIYQNIGAYDKAILHFSSSLDVAQRFNDEISVAQIVWSIVGIYKTEDPKKGLEFLSSLPNKYLHSADVHVRAMINLAHFSAFLANKQYSDAKYYCDQLLYIERDTSFRDYNSLKDDVYRTAIKYYSQTGQTAKARYYLELNKENIRNAQNPLVIAQNAALWYKVDSADQDFKSAFDHLNLYHTITDSIYQATKSRQFQLLLVEYETRKKEDSIRQKSQDIVLLTQKNDQQKARLENAIVLRNSIIAGTALVLVILALLYRQYRLKQKSNRIITHKNGLLQHLLTEKEWLLKEIHHRVKNNLQMVMSILNTQTAFIDNDVALAAIQNSQDRVHSMALIHQKLFNSENLSTIDIASYVRELVSYLSDSYNIGQQIRFEFNTEPLELDVSQAIPLGLILNEAITNSIKYAFPGGIKGVITISISNRPNHTCLLQIQDNGIGIPDDFRYGRRGSLGINLMTGLSEDLGGQFNIENNHGTIIKISFVAETPGQHSTLLSQPILTEL